MTAQPGEEETQGDLINSYKYLKVPSNRTRGSENKMEQSRFCLNISKHFCAVQLTEH